MQNLDKYGTMNPTQQSTRLVEVRGASGRLYAMYDPQRGILEFKRGAQTEQIDLTPYQKQK